MEEFCPLGGETCYGFGVAIASEKSSEVSHPKPPSTMIASPRLLAGFLTLAAAPLWAAVTAEPTKEQLDFFEGKIRPILAENCFKCHSIERGKSKGELTLDTKDGLEKGGETGKAIVPGDPEKWVARFEDQRSAQRIDDPRGCTAEYHGHHSVHVGVAGGGVVEAGDGACRHGRRHHTRRWSRPRLPESPPGWADLER